MGKPTFAQTQHFYRLVEEGKVTSENFQFFLEDPLGLGLLVIYDEFTLFGRTYELLQFQPDKKWADGMAMARWAKLVKADLGKEDAEHLLKYQDHMPGCLVTGRIDIIFTGWRESDDPSNQISYLRVVYLTWLKERMVKCVSSLQKEWDGRRRLIRRKSY